LSVKPKIFIGSSAEGLNIAYAIQQNLTHSAESTVWDQGVFNPSSTTIESLSSTLEQMDFGVFVFSGDDVTTMRNVSSTTVRDNVLFELGLFIGKLGRERVFFVVPDGEEIHIPSDLLGVTSGKYETNRSDGSMQASTGAVSNQIRSAMKSLGLLRERIEDKEFDEKEKEISAPENNWSIDFLNDDFASAKDKLEEIIVGKSGSEKNLDQAWIYFMQMKLNYSGSVSQLCKLADENIQDADLIKSITNMLNWEDYSNKSVEIAEKFHTESDCDYSSAIVLSCCHEKNGDRDKAITLLESHDPKKNPEVALELADIFDEGTEERIKILRDAYENHTNHENLIYTFARELQEQKSYKEALYLLDFLTINYSANASYWGYLSNTCVALQQFEKGMFACRKAEHLTESTSAWILHNIGNMLNTKGFYSESISWLKKGLAIEPDSEYAHDRMAKALASKSKEHSNYVDLKNEGRKLLRNYVPPSEEDA